MDLKLNNVQTKLKESVKANTDLAAQLKEAEAKILNLEESLENRTNRQLRNTQVWSNIPGENKEKWDVTRATLASTIARISSNVGENEAITEAAALSMIERAHRGKPYPNQTGPSPIYVAIDNWQNAQKIKSIMIKAGKSGVSEDIYCNQKYGPRTNWRRKRALDVRKDLIQRGIIEKGFVDFPAVLMVQMTGENEYKEYKNFSKIPVDFSKK